MVSRRRPGNHSHYTIMSWNTKLSTTIKTVKRVKNWPTVVGRQTFRCSSCTICFRDGLVVTYRPHTLDWETIKEVMLDGVYLLSLRYLAKQARPLAVLDFGANIGLFSLRALKCNQRLEVHAFEPAPNNIAALEINQRANPELSPRLHIHPEAVGGYARTARFFYDETIPQGSTLFGENAGNISVTVRSFSEIVESTSLRLGLVKLDVEGAEYEIFEQTPAQLWGKVPAIAIEIHADPTARRKSEDLVRQIRSLGYSITAEASGRWTYFCQRHNVCS
jgi:FkbM family methyltransferase